MPKTTKKTLNIKHDLYDTEHYKKLAEAPVIKETIQKFQHDFPILPELLQDTFNGFFKYEVDFEAPADVEPEYQINRNLLEHVIQSQEFKQLRANTKLNDVNSATAASTMTESLITNNKDEFKALKEYLESLTQAQQDLKDITKQIKQLGKAAKTATDPDDQQQIAAQQQVLQQNAAQSQQTIAGAQQQIQTAQQSINVTQALQASLDAIQAQEEMLGGWGSDAGTLTPVQAKDRLALQQALLRNKNLLQIMKYAGRMRRLAVKKQKQKTHHSMEEISDITQSDDIAHLLPTEAMLLMDPALEPIFLKHYAEKQCLTYDLQGNETKTKGPVIVCLDVSGSMGGQKDCWAKGVALAMVEIAHRENRNCIVMTFDTQIQAVFEFWKGQFDFSVLLKLASYYSGGGTWFDPPLKKSMEYIEREKQLKNADIILVTDGEADVSPRVREEFIQLKVKLKFALHTIVIGEQYGMVQHSLKPISDQLTPVADLTDDLAADLFEAI